MVANDVIRNDVIRNDQNDLIRNDSQPHSSFAMTSYGYGVSLINPRTAEMLREQ